MKSYVANGTGSQQTLTESQDNKIPVYDSLTDAEADLSNLEEGQLLATKDTGSELSAPVDTVQSGNMHAVTSNAVAGLTYKLSTVTGNDAYIKWVDMPSGFTEQNCFVIGVKLYHSNHTYCEDTAIQILISNTNVNQVGIGITNSAFYNRPIDILLMKK